VVEPSATILVAEGPALGGTNIPVVRNGNFAGVSGLGYYGRKWFIHDAVYVDNFLFVDGHAESMRLPETLSPNLWAGGQRADNDFKGSTHYNGLLWVENQFKSNPAKTR
jgi:hypothetical protein